MAEAPRARWSVFCSAGEDTDHTEEEGLFDILKADPYNLDLHAERILTVYRWRSKPEFTSHESVVLQPWSSGPNPKPLDIYLRIHLVLDSPDAVKPKVVSQILPYKKGMLYVCESKVLLAFQEKIMNDYLMSLGLYGYESSCITFAEMQLRVLSTNAVKVDQVSSEHHNRQKNTTPLRDQAKLFLANVGQVIFLSDNFHDLIFFLALLGGPFVGFGVVYFIFAAFTEAIQGVEFTFHTYHGVGAACRRFWIRYSHLSFKEFVSTLYEKELLKVVVVSVETALRLSCMFLFKVWVIWLWSQGSLSILGPLILENSICCFMSMFEEVIKGPNMWGSRERLMVVNWCGSFPQAVVWVVHRRFFKFLLSLMLFLSGPWLILGSLAVLCLVWATSHQRFMEYQIAMGYFTGWSPTILFPAYCTAVVSNLVLSPMAEIHVDPWMVNCVFYCVFVFSAVNCSAIYARVVTTKKGLKLENTAPLEALSFNASFPAVKQAVVRNVMNLAQVPREVWLFLLQRAVKLVKNLVPLHTPLFTLVLVGPWILWYLGFSSQVCYVLFVCFTYMFVVSVGMFDVLKSQIDICLKYYEQSS